MSKGGGAGKVYFVLYLAVVLELLIIIVERDEAEELLRKKQKETMRIVESILSQLQSGAGTEGINTRPQDEITIPPAGIDLKEVMGSDIRSFRKYIVEVGVTDVSSALNREEGESQIEYNRRLKKLVKLANVEEIEYQIFYNDSDDPNNAPLFLSDDTIRKNKMDFTQFEPGFEFTAADGTPWQFLGLRKLVLDDQETYNRLPANKENLTPEMLVPVYPLDKKLIIGPELAPDDIDPDSVFFYSEDLTGEEGERISSASSLKKRSFVVFFEPPSKAGWYKLRFASQTNRILGVRADENYNELPEETTVNIGTVQLTVKDLRKVLKELVTKLDKYELPSISVLVEEQNIDRFKMGLDRAKTLAGKDENPVEMKGKIDLYGYIAKLLAPGQSVNFDQNRGSIEFNVRVVTPEPKLAKPVISSLNYIACFDQLKPVFQFSISPYQGEGSNVVTGRVLDWNNEVVAEVDCRPLDQIADANVSAPTRGEERKYRGYVGKVLPAASGNTKYKLEITHRLGSQTFVDTTEMEIFPTKLANEDRVKAFLESFAVYGNRIQINAEPSSGNKILSQEFRTYIYSDKTSQPTPIDGIVATGDNALYCEAQAEEVFLRISWVQPYSGLEVDLLPTQSVKIKQEPPSVSTITMGTNVSGPETKINVRATNIRVSGGQTGDPDNPTADLQVSLAGQVDGKNIRNYDVSDISKPEITKEGETYTINFTINGKLQGREDKVTGSVSVPLQAVSINPINGKTSAPKPISVNITLDYEPERLGGRSPAGGRRPGGGGRPAQPQPQQQRPQERRR